MSDMLDDMLSEARDCFQRGKPQAAEPILQQLLLKNARIAEVHQMIGTLAYERGQFKKAIQAFQRALEIDPAFTDASVGLSIILNDLGRYDEGRKIFQEARARLDRSKVSVDSWLNEKIVQKHEELAELYSQARQHEDALNQLRLALRLGLREQDLQLRIADVCILMGRPERAVKDLRRMTREKPRSLELRLKLGLVLYHSNNVAEAVEQWETILSMDPRNAEARRNLSMAQAAGITSLGL